jgi:hypothetical protein
VKTLQITGNNGFWRQCLYTYVYHTYVYIQSHNFINKLFLVVNYKCRFTVLVFSVAKVIFTVGKEYVGDSRVKNMEKTCISKVRDVST